MRHSIQSTVGVAESRMGVADEISRNNRAFQYWIGCAEEEARLRHWDEAVVLGAAAAQLAWDNHPGVFFSPRLEALLEAIGRDMPSRSIPTGTSRPHILHVLTESYDVGGHTRLAYRWMRAASNFQHSLVLTRQRYRPPADLINIVLRQGGMALDLLAQSARPTHRIGLLRSLVHRADLSILHIHPSDAVAVAAVAPPTKAPVVMVNHADHVYWLGRRSADRYLAIRDVSIDLASERRELPRPRQQVIPIPLDNRPQRQERGTATASRNSMGIAGDATVILTVAHAYKYESSTRHYLNTLGALLASHPQAVLVAVGPEPHGQWLETARRFPGRVYALGIRDARPYYAAADVYVDSYPFTSITSLLEAAQFGVPAVALCTALGSGRILCPSGPGVDGGVRITRTPAEFLTLLSRLVEDPAFRQSVASDAAEQVENSRQFDWDNLTADLTQLEPNNRAAHMQEPDVRCDPLDVYLAQKSTAASRGRSIRSQAAEASLRLRLRIAARLAPQSPIDAALALPGASIYRLAAWRRRITG